MGEAIRHLGQDYHLSVLRDCNDEQRFDDWQREGGALLNNRNLGCGINSLTYLGVFTRQQGNALVNVVNARGSTFNELMDYVFNNNGRNPQFMFHFNVDTLDNVINFINILTQLLCENCCTIVKFMRYPDDTPHENAPLCGGEYLTSGHTIIFSKNNNVLWAIDPQQGTRRRSDDPARAFAAWNRHCYRVAYLMFNIQNIAPQFPVNVDNPPLQQLPDHGPVPMDIDEPIYPYDNNTTVPMDIAENNNNDTTVHMDIDGGNKTITKKSKKSKKSKKRFTRRNRK